MGDEPFKIVFQEEALASISDAYDYIYQENPDAAAKWYVGIMSEIHALSSLPFRYPIAPENASLQRDVRLLLYGKNQHKYRILFTIDRDTVHVLHVRHGARRSITDEIPDQ